MSDIGFDMVRVHALCLAWADWRSGCVQPIVISEQTAVLAGLACRRVGGGELHPFDVRELHAFDVSVLAQPAGHAKAVFEAHYLMRVRNIKRAADLMGMGRAHWYRLLDDFRINAWHASRRVLSVGRVSIEAGSAAEPVVDLLVDAGV
jgi:hypothetical protein